MKISPCKNYLFGQNVLNNNLKKKKNWGMGALAYATICAIYPHNIEKMSDTLGANFKKLPMKDKIKNITKTSIPFFGHPLLVLGGLGLLVTGIKKIEKIRNNKETN